jgi:fatty-acyl-CoA synthase
VAVPTLLSFPEIVRASAIRRPDAVAIILDRESRTFFELLAGGERRAREILGLGLVAGDRLGVLMPNSIELIEILLGAAMVGVVTVPINTRFKSTELAHIVTDSGMSALWTCDGIPGVVSYPDLLCESLPGLGETKNPFALDLTLAPRLRTIITQGEPAAGLSNVSNLRSLANARPLPQFPDPEHPLLLMYTSGTTAKPKGCIVPHRAITANAQSIGSRYGISSNDVWWCPLPMFHIGGLLFLTVMLDRAGLYVGMSHFTPEAAFDLIDATRPTVFYPLFPTITLALMDHPRFDATALDSIRCIFSVAPADVQRKIQAAFSNATLFSAFGMTETCGAVAFNLSEDTNEQRMNTCGSALPGWELEILDPETRTPVAPDVTGEIAVKGVGLFKGYLNDPELTARQFTDRGFFMTGDIGTVDAGGRLRFLGRLKDQLKVGGENVSALEVESFLATHPAIKLAQVVGIADDKYGEVPVAFVETAAMQSISEEEVIAFCVGKIARFKIPRHVRIVREWPMSATKILKYRLREQIELEFARGLQDGSASGAR